MKYIVKDNEAAFVKKNGIFQKMLTAGTYHFTRQYEVMIEEMSGEVKCQEIPYQILIKDPEFEKSTIHMEIPDGQAGFLYKNGKLITYANRKEYLLWNRFSDYKLELFSMEDPEMDPAITKQMRMVIPSNLYTSVLVSEGQTGLVYYDNVLKKTLSKGSYFYWNYHHSISYTMLDLRQQELDITGQEILTKDKIGIRMNMTALYKITDAVRFTEQISDLKGQLYSVVQLVLRAIVGNYKLDEILEAKEKISAEIYDALKKREEMFCITFLMAGIKDIILPGEIREIMNSVLVAEKNAQASVITRREEVASTRSLLNTAKLMEENQTLYKLKELEYLERICERVGEISINGNTSVVEQLGRIMGTARS